MTKNDMQEGRARAIANSARLFEDAKLLIEHSRFASAFTIAVRGLEEIGKVILDTWNAIEPLPVPKTRSNAHDLKKMAVGSVFLGTFAMRQFGLPLDDISNDLIAQVGPVFRDSWEGRVLGMIGFRVPEPTYRADLSREPPPAEVDPSLMSRKDVETVFAMAKILLDLLLDGKAMHTGLLIYNQELARRWFGPLPIAQQV
jgi:hypothetical protein